MNVKVSENVGEYTRVVEIDAPYEQVLAIMEAMGYFDDALVEHG